MVIAHHLDDLDAAEAHVNEIYFAWRVGKPTPLDDELDSMLSRWLALADREELHSCGGSASRGSGMSGSSRRS